VFWSTLENAPRSALAGYLAKKRGVKPGLADIMVVYGLVFSEKRDCGAGRVASV
jgi:hypothetical protein